MTDLDTQILIAQSRRHPCKAYDMRHDDMRHERATRRLHIDKLEADEDALHLQHPDMWDDAKFWGLVIAFTGAFLLVTIVVFSLK